MLQQDVIWVQCFRFASVVPAAAASVVTAAMGKPATKAHVLIRQKASELFLVVDPNQPLIGKMLVLPVI